MAALSIHVHSLLMRMEGGIGEALPIVFPEELAVCQADVVDLIT